MCKIVVYVEFLMYFPPFSEFRKFLILSESDLDSSTIIFRFFLVVSHGISLIRFPVDCEYPCPQWKIQSFQNALYFSGVRESIFSN